MGKKTKAPEAPAAPPAEIVEMVFHCQLAHGSATKQIRDFTNVKELYEVMAKAFSIKTEDIMYCTLNTHKVAMDRLLGGQIGLDDFLFAHCKGAETSCKITKSGPALGLTISDNGAGQSFVKNIRADSLVAASKIQVGDVLKSLNGTGLLGMRHFEVAKLLKEIPVGSEFEVICVSPQAGLAGVDKRPEQGGSGTVGAGGGKKTVRMKKDGSMAVETVDDKTEELVTKIDDMMESFIGIRDAELSRTIFDLAKETKDPELFAGQLDKKLSDFEFPDDFVLDAFELVNA